MIIWIIWTLPILAAIVVAARRSAPGPWIDSLFHFFGIGAIDCRRAVICALVIVAVVGWATDAILARTTALGWPWRQIDGLAIGALAALSVLMLAGWLSPRPGVGEPSASTTAPERDGEAR